MLVAVGGGGLIAGVAAWFAGRVKVVGVEPFASPTLTRALEAGHPVDAEAGGLAADSLAPQRVGERVFPIAREYALQTVLVSDEAIAERSSGAVADFAYRGGAGRRRRVLGAAVGSLQATARRARGRRHQRRQYRRGQF